MISCNWCCRAILLLGTVAILGGCTTRLGMYRAASYDIYRPRVADEQVVIHTEDIRPIQWIVAETHQVVQGIPVTLELASNHSHQWRDLVGAFSIMELRRLGEGRVVYIDSVSAFLLPYVHGPSAKLENYPSLRSANFDEARTHGAEALRELTESASDGRQHFFLICVRDDGRPCLEFERRYELRVLQPSASPTAVDQPVAVYPFRMEHRSFLVTAGIGALLIAGFLTWAAG